MKLSFIKTSFIKNKFFKIEALSSLKVPGKPDRGPLLSHLRLVTSASRKDCSAVLRIFCELRLADAEVQLPMAHTILDEWIIRLFSIL